MNTMVLVLLMKRSLLRTFHPPIPKMKCPDPTQMHLAEGCLPECLKNNRTIDLFGRSRLKMLVRVLDIVLHFPFISLFR